MSEDIHLLRVTLERFPFYEAKFDGFCLISQNPLGVLNK